MKQSKGEKIFSCINYILLSVMSFAAVYPLIYVLSASISTPEAVTMGKVMLFPIGFELNAYKEVLSQSGIWIAYGNAVYLTVVGTIVQLLITVLGAYPLSKKRLKGKGIITFFIALTMWFHAGMIPSYLNIRDLGLYNTRTAIIIAFACNTFYVFLLRTYFQSVPDSLEESAKIDGANDIIIMSKIYLPVSLPALATIALYYAVGRWNGYFWSMVLLRDDSKIPLQVFLRKIIVEMSPSEQSSTAFEAVKYSKETIIYATIMVAVIPMLMLYPFIQRYFIKGIMVGSIKG